MTDQLMMSTDNEPQENERQGENGLIGARQNCQNS